MGRRIPLLSGILFSLLLSLVGCGKEEDGDGDGFSVEAGDCADFDAARFPGAPETCNLLDDDCDDLSDEDFDLDQDGASPCTNRPDCNESDPTIFPDAPELEDGLDNDCDNVIDNNLPSFDDDGDSFSDDDGDCDDADPLTSPGAPEIVGDELDNDCNGQTDEQPTPCDGGALNPDDPLDLATAIGLCHGEVVSAEFIGPSDARARDIISSFGTGGIVPFEGSKMIHISSGIANTNDHSPGTNLSNGNNFAYPDPKPDPNDGCGQADPPSANDYTEYRLQIRVPENAQSFSFKFQFFSSEYPRFRCSDFDDTFLAILDSEAFQGNISFDSNNKVVSVNSGFFEICEDDDPNQNGGPPNICPFSPNPTLNGTGFDPTADASGDGGATQDLTTTSAVVPGELMTLRFIIFDEGFDPDSASFGHILDSSVLIDNFVWRAEPVETPKTIP